MDQASPARLYALLVGAAFVIAGTVGFFYSSDFGSPGQTGELLGLLDVNGWHNVAHIAAGVLGLLAVSYGASRNYALGIGAVFLGVAVWGFIIGSGNEILGLIPVSADDNVLDLALGVLGVAAATPGSTPS